MSIAIAFRASHTVLVSHVKLSNDKCTNRKTNHASDGSAGFWELRWDIGLRNRQKRDYSETCIPDQHDLEKLVT